MCHPIGRVGCFSINSYGTTSTSTLGLNNAAAQIVLVWDRNGIPGLSGDMLAVYHNGQRVTSFCQTGVLAWGSAWPAPIKLNTAGYNTGLASGTVDLDLAYDDLRIYNAPLTATEIAAIYQAER
jgi:hypothetical protein